MGIKFFCPNGHKLNVKTFLGGKKAICPKCGAKVLVPMEGVGADTADAGEGGQQEPDLATAGAQAAFAPGVADAAFGAEAAGAHGVSSSVPAYPENQVQPPARPKRRER